MQFRVHPQEKVSPILRNGRTWGFPGKDGGRRKSHSRQRYFRDGECADTEL